MEFGDYARDALGELGGEVAEVAEDGRQAGGEEERENDEDGGDEDDDGDGARRLVVADFELGDAVDGGHEDYGEQSANVEDEEFFLEGVSEGQKQ